MVTDEAKKQIQLEETYRAEVRRSLDQPVVASTRASSLWKFFNSPLGLWLLSTIFVTGLGAAYALYQEHLRARAENTAAVERLDLEIEHRFSIALQRLFALHERPSSGGDAEEVKRILRSFAVPPEKAAIALYPEYAGFSTLALLAELRRRLPPDPIRPAAVPENYDYSKHQRDALTKDISLLSALQFSLAERADVSGTPEAAAKYIQTKLRMARWRDNFFFTDCGKDAFC